MTDVGRHNATGEVGVESEGGATIVVLRGEHDLTTAANVRLALEEAIANGRPVVVDVSETSFLDTSVLHVLFTAAATLRRDGSQLAVQCTRELPIYRVFDVSGLVSELAFSATREDAISAATAPA